jgi:HK97 family phage portal protein
MAGFFQRIKSIFSIDEDGTMGIVGSGDYSRSFPWSRSGSLTLYEKSLYANAAIKKRSEKTGEIQFVLKDRTGEEVTTGDAEKWLALLNKPNDWQTGAQFWGLAQKYYDTVGACYIRRSFGEEKIFKIGYVPDKLVLLKADKVEPILNADKTEILKFRYNGDGAAEDIPVKDIIYWYNPNPREPLTGESLLASASSAIESEYQISKYHANVLRNGGKLETMFRVKGLTTQKQLTELEEGYQEKFTEAKRLGRPLFMGGDIESVSVALSPQELAFLDTKISNYRDLAIVTGVPKEVLANTDGSTYQNADAAIRIFLRETVKPNMKSLCTVLDWRIIPDDWDLSFVDPTPEDREETRKDLETAKTVQALTTNEMREKLGFEPVKEEEADTILIPFSLRSLGEIIEPTPAVEPTKEPEETDEEKEKKKLLAEQAHPLRDKKTRILWAKAVDRDRREYDARMLAATKRYFKEQSLRVLDSLKSKRKMAVAEVFNEGVELSIAKTTLVTLIRDIFVEQGQKTADTFGFPTFSLTQAVEESLKERAELFTTSIINTQKEKLVRTFAESAAAEESRAKLVARIQDLYTDVSQDWAAVIARTEVHAAVSNANLQAYYQGGLRIKIWTAVLDDRTRPEHADLDGQERAIDAPFSNGLQYPSEPNCRCTV